MSDLSAALARCQVDVRRVHRWIHEPRSVALARAELRDALSAWGLSAAEDDAVVVLSELMTNAVVHARLSDERCIETVFCRGWGGVRMAVDDADERVPQLRDQDVEGGRGLAIVAELSDRWGVHPRRRLGKSVWAIVSAPGGRYL
ncbi:ATP-binding protein [Streptomyces sp. NPDC053079]|uniref:ATP-binding protein n=1 Tax=Streptomyces sp. NPDC053079 TaxID=3365697 RepID=UPI0037D6DBE2